jgi:hypothetical protein
MLTEKLAMLNLKGTSTLTAKWRITAEPDPPHDHGMWLNYKLKKCNAIEIGWEVPTVTSIEHLDARSGCPRLPNSETLVPVWRTDSADAKAVLHTGTNSSAFGTS